MQDFTDEWVQRDHELIEGIRSSDPERVRLAQCLYIRMYNQRLFRRVRAFAVGDANAEDLCQEAWLTALRKLRAGEYRPQPGRTSFAWLTGIGHNKVRTWHRSVFREERRIRNAQRHEPQPEPEPGPDDVVLSQQRAERVRRALQVLTHTQRLAITKWCVNGIYEVAEKRRLAAAATRALKQLRKLLDEEESTDVTQSK